MDKSKPQIDEDTKNAVRKLLCSVFVVGVLVGCEILVMIHGWGVQPKSWWWIIGAGFFLNVFLRHLASYL